MNAPNNNSHISLINHFLLRFVVMGPSRAGSSWRIFGSLRLVAFSSQLEIEKWLKTSRNFDSRCLVIILIHKVWTLLNWIVYAKTTRTPIVRHIFMETTNHRIDCDHDTVSKLKNFVLIDKYFQLCSKPLSARLTSRNSSSNSSLPVRKLLTHMSVYHSHKPVLLGKWPLLQVCYKP